MVWIPGGEFTMGDNSAHAHMVEKPAHRVRVDGFWMDQTEVTNAQFAAFVQEYLDWHDSRPTGPSLLRAFIIMLDPSGSKQSLSYTWGGFGRRHGEWGLGL